MASPYRIKHKPSKRASSTLRVLLMLVFFGLVIIGFIYTFLIDTQEPKKQKTATPLYPAIHAEDLGKSPKDLKHKYPDLFLSNDRYGKLIGKHTLDGANYYIWFVAENKAYKAFRIKADKTYKKLEEKEVLQYFASLYGRPFDGQCNGKTTFAMDKCHFKWWVRKGVSLDLYSRYKSNKTMTLSAVTSDTYLMSKHHQKVRSVLPTQ